MPCKTLVRKNCSRPKPIGKVRGGGERSESYGAVRAIKTPKWIEWANTREAAKNSRCTPLLPGSRCGSASAQNRPGNAQPGYEERARACVADGVQHPRCNSVLPMQSGSVVSSDMEIYCVWLIALFIAIILMAVLLPELGPPNRLVRRSGTSVRFSHDTLLQTNSKAQTQQRK